MSSTESYDPAPLERLFLWRLAAGGGGDWLKELTKPKLGTGPRNRLIKSGLIELEQRKPSGQGRALKYLCLTDAGWAWCAEHMGTEVSNRSTAGGEILRMTLARLKRFLDHEGMTFGQLVAISDQKIESDASTTSPTDEAARVEAAYFQHSGGRPNVRVRLADLRSSMPDVARGDLDELLLSLERDGRLVLFPIDDPHDIGPADRDAVLRVPGGAERHVVYIGGARS
ncbi:hypothetical protein Pan216_16660 [Planctomycetes bacterium Pan216]|uniref:Uncharacterized protein n=1 Tax=Kolteria novifilia TaxID=2527975 RepID=A0A518B1G0_9BACT|nr:hypothetical protein Pan216_16660 [Planctomycetes bacterium Pan216]